MIQFLSAKEDQQKKFGWNKGNGVYYGTELFEALTNRNFTSWTIWGKVFNRDLSLKIYNELAVKENLIIGEDLLFLSYYSHQAKNVCYVQYDGYHYNLSNDSGNRIKYTLSKAQSHITNLAIVSKGLDKLVEVNNLNTDTFDKIKLELVQGYLVKINDLSEPNLSIIQHQIIILFEKQILELAIQKSVMKHNVFRIYIDQIIKKRLVPNHWLYENLRRLILKFIKK